MESVSFPSQKNLEKRSRGLGQTLKGRRTDTKKKNAPVSALKQVSASGALCPM
jgi:hypothetical protein